MAFGAFDYHDLERAALSFVLEDDIWPLFLAAAREGANTAGILDYLDSAPGDALRAEARFYWLIHSPDPAIRALAVNIQP